MLRKTLNASRLQEEVARRLQRLQAVQEDGVKIQVPRPRLRAPDASGCNWDMPEFGNAVGFKRDIASVLEAVRREFNLVDHAGGETPPLAQRPGRVDPFGGHAEPAPRKAGDPFAPAAED